ncbi:MAG: FtsX-like permease family protein, partial [Verrucomicrobiota bacterium]
SLVVIVGAFCITNTMITVTVQKGAEIGLLKALGSTESQIAKIFLIQGTIVGFIGIIIGVLVAQVTLHFRNDVAMFIAKCLGRDELFPAEIYGLDGGLPAVQTPSDVIAICAAAFLFCVFASLIPAIIAAVKQPAKALRSE